MGRSFYGSAPTGRRSRWLQWSGAVLACVVVISSGLTNCGYAASQYVNLDDMTDTKVGVLRLPKHISVGNRAICAETPCLIVPQNQPIVSIQRVRHSLYPGSFAGPDQSDAGVVAIRQGIVKINWERIGEYSSPCGAANFVGRRLACIFDFYEYSDGSGLNIRPLDILSENNQIGPQLPFGRIFKVSQLTLASVPQSISGSFERVGEIANYASGDGSYQNRVAIKLHDNVADKGEEYIVTFAMFAGLCWLTYLCFRRNKS